MSAMYLSEIKIRNFRKIEDLIVFLPKGLTLLVGENNAGKTTIIDAIRLLVFPPGDYDSIRLTEDDFRRETNNTPIEITGIFSDLTDEDEIHFMECLVAKEDGKFKAQINLRIEFNLTNNRVNPKRWGGETEGGRLSSDLYNYISSIYLKPLRDPDDSLRPGPYSQVSRLVNCLTSEDQKKEFEAIAEEANEKTQKLKPVEEAKKDIDTQMKSIAGSTLAQKTKLIFSPAQFNRIVAGLHPEIDGLPFNLNGLGYNNLIYAAMSLGALRESSSFSYRSILVEEPEAHLHPQLQVLLLRHLAESVKENDDVQIITSTHSPILASQAPIDSIVSVYEDKKTVSCCSISQINYNSTPAKVKKLKKKLQRYLDATRAELFFARKILMVEGIAEAILIPVLAKKMKLDLKDSAVTIINAEGLNFDAFIPLIREGGVTIPTSILTDGDPQPDKGIVTSDTTRGLKKEAENISNLCVEHSEVTFEHELAKDSELLKLMLSAYLVIHPQKGKELVTEINKLTDKADKAAKFLNTFAPKTGDKTSKGLFAQELADLIEDSDLSKSSIPEYIQKALIHITK